MRQTASSRFHVLAALFLALAMAGTVGTALGFEHIGGFIPCKLCLAQREPYYAGVPVALLALAGAAFGWRGCFTRGMFVIAGLLMSYGVILSIYHSGVEWHWWPGPADCGAAATSGITTDAGDLLGALDSVTPPSCDEAAGRFLGLSFAGWNVLASLALAVVAWRAAFGRD
jgi:disulfide bond formation protein DsbB